MANPMATKSPHVSIASVKKGRRLSHDRDEPTTWHPIWLSKTVLFAFLALFLLLGLSLILINHFVTRYRGLPLSLTDNHYAWTYGPTVILVLVVGLWRRVNYCCMVNQPWHELSNGPQTAAKTVLLDYLWPLQINSFIAAVKNRHFAVVATILNFAILKAIIVISTTLFRLDTSVFSEEVQVSWGTKFGASQFWEVTPPVEGLGTRLGGHTYHNISSDPVWTYSNLRKEYPDLSFPIELSAAITNFSLASEVPGKVEKVSAPVEIFQPNATCEIAEFEWPEVVRSYTNLTMHAPSCNVGSVEFFMQLSPDDPECPLTTSYFQVERVDCVNGGAFRDGVDGEMGIFKRVEENTYQYIVTAFEFQRSACGRNTTGRVLRAASVACSLTYSMHMGTAEALLLDTFEIDSLRVESETIEGGIANFTNLQFSEAVFSSLQTAASIFPYGNLVLSSLGGGALLGLIADPDGTADDNPLEPFYNATNLQRATQDALEGVGHQLMRRYFLLPDDGGTLASGSVEYGETRLHILPGALWAMVVLFDLMACLVIIVIACTKQGVAPRSPSTLVSSAYALARSPDMGMLLRGAGAKRSSQIRDILSNYKFEAVREGGTGPPRIEAVEVSDGAEKLNRPEATSDLRQGKGPSSQAKPKSKRRWVPYPARRHAIAQTLALPLVSVAVLEILWHFSETDHSFVTIPNGSSVAEYAVRFGSTATVLLIATMFSSLDFTIATMTPFSALAADDNGTSAERTLLFSIVEDLPPVALYKAVRHKHAGAALSLMASTIGSVLTIVASGLWFLHNAVEISQPATAEIESGWSIDFGSINSTADGASGAPGLFNEMQHGARVDPGLVWDNIVLPTIGNVEVSDTDPERHSYSFPIPAVRAMLECSTIPSSFLFDIDNEPSNNHIVKFTATAQLPAGCIQTSEFDDSDSIALRELKGISQEGSEEELGWVAGLWDVPVTPVPGSVPSEGCPSLGAIFARYVLKRTPGEDKPRKENFNATVVALVCTQHLEAVEATVTYHDASDSTVTPNLTTSVQLNSTIPPMTLRDSRSNISSLSYAIADHFDLGTTSFLSVPNVDFSPFFEHLTMGPDKASNEDLLDPDTLIKAITYLYQKFMARVIDMDYRVPLDTAKASSAQHMQPLLGERTLRGTSTRTVSRLKLSKASKIILQAMLGAMVILGGLAYWLVSMRGTLPRVPYSIANSMALFEGSRLLDVDRGEEESDDASDDVSSYHQSSIESGVKRGGSWRAKGDLMVKATKGKLFRLGWWENANGVERARGGSQTEALRARQRFGIDMVQR